MMNYSIIVPYYDKYDLFKKAVDSIPDRDDIQVVIVDNAPHSLDKKLIPRKENAKVIYITSSPDKGAGCARNEGLRHVAARYILFLDADDYFASEAFTAFDRYLEKDYDIVFFQPTSVYLSDNSLSDRHIDYEHMIKEYLTSHDERRLRYRWDSPWAKLYRADFVLGGNFYFEEKPVGNDAWFSLQTGHNAKKITVDYSVVYVVTEGKTGQSLTKKISKENVLIRYEGAIRINKFLKKIGQYDMHIRLLGFLRTAYSNFGFLELIHFLKIAFQEKANIF